MKTKAMVQRPLERVVGRAELIERAKTLRAEIQQIFDDADHWNRVHVPWKGEPIDPDPNGELRRFADGLDLTLKNAQPNTRI